MTECRWLFVSGNVPSLKNSKEIVEIPIRGAVPCPACKRKRGTKMLVPSKTHKRYMQATAPQWRAGAERFRTFISAATYAPVFIALYFVRDSRRRWDFGNATATVEDAMVGAGWVEDDNSDIMVPVYAGHHIDPKHAGVFIAPLLARPEVPVPPLNFRNDN